MEKNKFIKGYIYKIENDEPVKIENIIFRLINLGNVFYFAEEIITGCIFPICNFLVYDSDKPGVCTHFSYLAKGKYFVFYPLNSGKKMFTYEFNKGNLDLSNFLSVPSDVEINKYLMLNEESNLFLKKIERMEKENIYFRNIEKIKKEISKLRNENDVYDYIFLDEPIYENVPVIDTKEIAEYGYDLSTQNELCNLVGREEEIKHIIKTVCIRGKSILIVGESGSGKTSLVEKLALQIKNNENDWLKNKMIFYLNVASLVSGTKYRGDFEKNLDSVIKFCEKNSGQIILFIDEIHTLYGLGRTDESSIDAMNLLKPYISNGTITIIGATTKLEYEKYMINDSAFIRRFDKLELSLPDDKMNTEILLSYIKYLEEKYKVILDIDDNKRIRLADYLVNITDIKNQRVVGDTKINNPTLCKNVIEDAFVEAVYNKKDKVTINDVCFSILSCDKLSLTYRKEKAEKLRTYLIEPKKVNTDNKVLALVKS